MLTVFENRAMLKVTFLVTNPGDVTVTVPVISYKLYADGSEIGNGAYSTEDVANARSCCILS